MGIVLAAGAEKKKRDLFRSIFCKADHIRVEQYLYRNQKKITRSFSPYHVANEQLNGKYLPALPTTPMPMNKKWRRWKKRVFRSAKSDLFVQEKSNFYISMRTRFFVWCVFVLFFSRFATLIGDMSVASVSAEFKAKVDPIFRSAHNESQHTIFPVFSVQIDGLACHNYRRSARFHAECIISWRQKKKDNEIIYCSFVMAQ